MTLAVAANAETASTLYNCPSGALLRSELVPGSVIVSVPVPPSIVSAPTNPVIESFPAPALMKSAPLPPESVSLKPPAVRIKPSPCKARSIDTAAVAETAETASMPVICSSFAVLRVAVEDVAVSRMVSVPPPPSTVSAAAKPTNVSAPELPVSVSALAVPVITKPSDWLDKLRETAVPIENPIASTLLSRASVVVLRSREAARVRVSVPSPPSIVSAPT